MILEGMKDFPLISVCIMSRIRALIKGEMTLDKNGDPTLSIPKL